MNSLRQIRYWALRIAVIVAVVAALRGSSWAQDTVPAEPAATSTENAGIGNGHFGEKSLRDHAAAAA